MKILYIDTSSNLEIKVGLELDGNTDSISRKVDNWKAQIVLPLINELLNKHNLKLQELNAIKVNPGPGSFTGLRVGITIANTLATWLKIPVNDKSIGEIIEPRYQ